MYIGPKIFILNNQVCDLTKKQQLFYPPPNQNIYNAVRQKKLTNSMY